MLAALPGFLEDAVAGEVESSADLALLATLPDALALDALRLEAGRTAVIVFTQARGLPDSCRRLLDRGAATCVVAIHSRGRDATLYRLDTPDLRLIHVTIGGVLEAIRRRT